MPGGSIQLIAYGSEDIYLIGDPQITFFIAIYKRYGTCYGTSATVFYG